MGLVLGRFGDESFFFVSASYDAARGALAIGCARNASRILTVPIAASLSTAPISRYFVRLGVRSTSLHRKRNNGLKYEIIYDAIHKIFKNINFKLRKVRSLPWLQEKHVNYWEHSFIDKVIAR